MALPDRAGWTEAAYLVFERSSEFKHEYVDGRLYLMAGASRRHNLIVAGIVGSLFQQVADQSCEIYASDMRVRVADAGLYTYPDVAIVCGEVNLLDNTGDTLLNPTVIIEVLSPTTEAFDRGEKFRRYRTLASLHEYILVVQDRAYLEQFVRQASGEWLLTEHAGLDAVLQLASVPLQLELADMYRLVSFEDHDNSSDPDEAAAANPPADAPPGEA